MKELDRDYVPALGVAWLSPFYDGVVRVLTRESAWRGALLDQIAPGQGEAILDVGCGTGTLAILMKQAVPFARIVGLDPDRDILVRAEAKARAAGVEIEWRQGYARDAASLGVRFDKVVSSLVFHQVPLAEKKAGILAMVAASGPRGEVHVADFARQNSPWMRRLFGIVGRLDGRENTQANADGALERIIGEVAPGAAEPTKIVRTPLGEISIFLVRASPQ
jgi:cyclopropane fatty-acyl-phospholipid synthase-like methyltransferase